MKKYLIALAASAAKAQVCKGDWYYGIEDEQVSYTTIDFGFLGYSDAFIVGGTRIYGGQNCAYIEYFDSQSSTEPNNVWRVCEYTAPSIDAATCNQIGGVPVSSSQCKIKLTGVQAIALDQKDGESCVGVFKTDSQILVFFEADYLWFQFSDPSYYISTIIGFDANFSLKQANQQFQITQYREWSAIIEDNLSGHSYILRVDYSQLEIAKYTNPVMNWNAIAYSYNSMKLEYVYIGADQNVVRSVYLMLPQSNQLEGLKNPSCLVKLLSFDNNFEAEFGSKNYQVAGAVAFNGHENVMVALHSLEINKPIVIGINSNGGSNVCSPSLQFDLIAINRHPAGSFVVQDITQDSNNRQRAAILAKETNTGDLEVFLIKLGQPAEFTSKGKISYAYQGTTALSTSISSFVFHAHNKNQDIFLFGQNNFGNSANNYGFLIRSPQTPTSTCLTLYYQPGFIQVIKSWASSPQQINVFTAVNQQPVPQFTRQTFTLSVDKKNKGTPAKNPCSLKLSFANPVMNNQVCQVSQNTPFTVYAGYQVCPFGSTLSPTLTHTLKTSLGVVASAPTSQIDRNTFSQTQSTFECKVSAMYAGQYTMDFAFSWSQTGQSLLAQTPYYIINSLPATPQAPTTVTNSNTSVTITWVDPNTQGLPILSYTVKIQNKDGSYANDLVNCDGSSTAILSSKTCTIPITTLIQAPFSLDWGSQIYATVSITTLAGTSSDSLPGSGALIVTNPSQPFQLQLAPFTEQTYIISWQPSASNGGSNIIGYSVWQMDSTSLSYTKIATDIAGSQYFTKALNQGTMYKFKITARNSFGESPSSEEKTIQIPVQISQTQIAQQTICNNQLITIKVAKPVGNRIVQLTDQIKSYVVVWNSFIINLNQNVSCQVQISYSVSITVIQGDVDISWFTTNTAAQQMQFQPQSQFTNSQVRISITGTLNDDSTLAQATDTFILSIQNKQILNQETDKREPQALNETTQLDLVLNQWTPPKRPTLQKSQPLYSQILSVDSYGKVKIGFSQLIMTPNIFQNLTRRHLAAEYQEIIQKLLQVKVNPGIGKANSNQSISSINITNWEPMEIELQINFTYPDKITQSRYERDELEIQIINAEFFVSIRTYERVQNRTVMKMYLPPQVSTNQHQAIEFVQDVVSTGFTVVASTNLVLNFFLASGLKYLWGLMNTLQFLVFITKWKLDFPVNALNVLEYIKMIALMEFIPTNWFTNTLSNWFGLQIGSQDNILENMGMMLLIGCCVAALVLVVGVSSLLMMLNYKIYKVIRKVLSMIMYNTFIRYILQSILKLQIGSLTTITTYMQLCNQTCLIQNYDKQIYIAWAIVIVLTCVPFVVIVILLKNYKNLDRPSIYQKIGSLYLGLKTNLKWAAVGYTPIFLIRRLFFVIFTFTLSDKPYLQVHLFIYMLIWYVIYIEMIEPHQERLQTTLEFVNETILLVICYHFVIWTGPGPELDTQTKSNLGWSCVTFVCILFLLNAFTMLIIQILAGLRKFKLWQLKRKQQKKRLENQPKPEINQLRQKSVLDLNQVALKTKNVLKRFSKLEPIQEISQEEAEELQIARQQGLIYVGRQQKNLPQTNTSVLLIDDNDPGQSLTKKYQQRVLTFEHDQLKKVQFQNFQQPNSQIVISTKEDKLKTQQNLLNRVEQNRKEQQQAAIKVIEQNKKSLDIIMRQIRDNSDI